MKKHLLSLIALMFAFVSIQIGFALTASAQWASNASGDLFGENMGNFIMIQWEAQYRAARYLMYGATALSGPWTLLLTTPDMKGGAKIDQTPDARLVDLCYKVEATVENGTVIRVYQPICVPKYAG